MGPIESTASSYFPTGMATRLGLTPLTRLFLNIGQGVKKLTGRYDLSIGPFHRKILEVAGHDVVGARGLGALQKNIVVGIGTGMHLLRRFDPESILPDSAECGFDYRLGAVCG